MSNHAEVQVRSCGKIARIGPLEAQAAVTIALLLSGEGWVIEGPTFTIAWVSDGVLETPTLDLGILASITRQAVLEAARDRGIEVREGRFPLERLQGASEAMGLSTLKEVLPIGAVGEVVLGTGPVTRMLGEDYRALVERETR